MADPDLEVDTDEVESLGDYLSTRASGDTGTFETLDGEVRDLNASWSGAAQQAFASSYTTWATQFTAQTEVLGLVGAALERIAGIYETAESDVITKCS